VAGIGWKELARAVGRGRAGTPVSHPPIKFNFIELHSVFTLN